MKNVRSNWLAEKMGELVFYENRDEKKKKKKKIARWSHLQELYKPEAESLVKMLKLTEVSVYPELIDRQSVATYCLRVFCEES